MYVWYLFLELGNSLYAEARKRPAVAAMALLLCCLLGANGLKLIWPASADDGKDALGEVSGTVLVGGEPVEGVSVRFEPLSGDRASVGVTDNAGRYRLYQGRLIPGAVVGEHIVRLSTARLVAEEAGTEKIRLDGETFPMAYNKESTLRATVLAGKNIFDWAITTLSSD